MKGIGFLIAIIIIGTLGRNIFPLDDDLYFLSESVCWVLVGGYIYHTSERYVRIISMFMTTCYISNLLDELFFTAWEFSFNKYLIAGIAFIYCSFLAIKLWMKEHNKTFPFKIIKT